MQKRYLAYIILLLLSGCRAYWAVKAERMEVCRNQWQYIDLKDTIHVKVLFFQAQSVPHTAVYGCNFIIGTSESLGTIAIADHSFIGDVKIGEVIEVLPSNWDETDKKRNHVLFTTYRNQKINDLYCALNSVYYGRVSK